MSIVEVLAVMSVLTLGAPFGIAAALQSGGRGWQKATWFLAGLIFGPFAIFAQRFLFRGRGRR